MAVSTAEMIARTMGRPRSNPQVAQPDPRLQALGQAQPMTSSLAVQPTGGSATLPSAQPMYDPQMWMNTGSAPSPFGGSAVSGAPTAPQAAPSVGGGLVQQLSGQTAMRTGRDMTSTADRFYQAGFTLPAGLVDQPSIDAYMKQKLQMAGGAPSTAQNQAVAGNQAYWLERNMTNPNYTGPDAAGIAALRSSGQPLTSEQIAAMRRQPGQPGQPQAPGVPGQGGQPGAGGLQGGLPGAVGAPGQISFAGINPDLMKALTGALTGQGIPQAGAAPGIDPQLLAAIKGQVAGEGMPTFQQVIEGSYEPWSQLMDEQFNTAMTQTFEQMVSRGVLQSGETQNRLTEMARAQGLTKGAYLGQLALDYTKERQQQIQSAIQQWGILDANRASNQTTITTANLQAATQIQATAMQTLTNLTTAMAQIQSAEKIAGADITSREKIAGMQISAQRDIAGMDIQSRQAIAEMQTAMQYQVAQLSAQAALQMANMDAQQAHNILTANMALEGIDWNRFQTDPVYAANVTNAIAIEKDAHLAIDQADAVNRQLPGVPQ